MRERRQQKRVNAICQWERHVGIIDVTTEHFFLCYERKLFFFLELLFVLSGKFEWNQNWIRVGIIKKQKPFNLFVQKTEVLFILIDECFCLWNGLMFNVFVYALLVETVTRSQTFFPTPMWLLLCILSILSVRLPN